MRSSRFSELNAALFGGFVSTMFLCCLQLHRINKYEALIRELTMKLEGQKE